MKRNELGLEIQKMADIAGENGEENTYEIYITIDELKKKKNFDANQEGKEEKGYDLITVEEAREEVLMTLKLKEKIKAAYPEMTLEARDEELKKSVHNRIFDTGPFLTSAFDTKSDYYSF